MRARLGCCAVKPASLKSSDFQQALGTRPVSRTAHFALHVLWNAPAAPELSTADPAPVPPLVDDSADRLGLVLPKKQARRSVTRSLIRHQARESVRRHGVHACQRLGPSVVSAVPARSVQAWVLRLTRGFDRQDYPSAASEALKAAVRAELDDLWARVRSASS